MYVLRRTGQGGGYVARAGEASSYVWSLDRARTYPTAEEANKDRCVENEVVVNVDELLRANSRRR